MEKEKALRRYIQSQQSLKAALASIPDDQKASVKVEGTWTVKELLCHFTGWDLTLLEPLNVFVKTGDFPVKVIHDHDAHNATQTSIRKDWSTEKIIEETTRTSQQLLDLVASLDKNQCQVVFSAPWGGEGTIPSMLAGLAWHLDEHLRHLAAAVNGSGTGKS